MTGTRLVIVLTALIGIWHMTLLLGGTRGIAEFSVLIALSLIAVVWWALAKE